MDTTDKQFVDIAYLAERYLKDEAGEDTQETIAATMVLVTTFMDFYKDQQIQGEYLFEILIGAMRRMFFLGTLASNSNQLIGDFAGIDFPKEQVTLVRPYEVKGLSTFIYVIQEAKKDNAERKQQQGVFNKSDSQGM